ncbi:MAG: hypothetical protein ACD_63C00091G0010 [uncultured bacterium]|nr:MAG: hypothetical protein ACD_63C00091G0010 [uncultured bacterium]
MQPNYIAKPKTCSFCEDNIKYIDYKDIKALRRHLSPYSRILAKERTGTCSKHQRIMAHALKRARFIGLLPYVTK